MSYAGVRQFVVLTLRSFESRKRIRKATKREERVRLFLPGLATPFVDRGARIFVFRQKLSDLRCRFREHERITRFAIAHRVCSSIQKPDDAASSVTRFAR